MRYYIATRLENHAQHNAVRDALNALGHDISYDWTTHGPVWRSGKDVIRQTAVKEMQWVGDADFVVVLLPGGRGTHAELGMALAYDKSVIAIGAAAMFEASPETCAFYHHPNVTCSRSTDAAEIAAQADTVAHNGSLACCQFLAHDGSSRCGVRRRDHAGMDALHRFNSGSVHV